MHLPNAKPTRRDWLRLGLGLGGLGLLPAARACEFHTDTLRVTHPYCHATGPSVSEAVVCMKFDEVSRSDRLVGVTTPVAREADIAGLLARPVVDFEIPAGEETWLHEHGTWLRLTGLRHPLHVGRTYPLQLDFAHGGTALATLTVDYPALRFR